MDEEAFSLSVRWFLKKLGVTAQREIELGVRERFDAGTRGEPPVPVLRATRSRLGPVYGHESRRDGRSQDRNQRGPRAERWYGIR